MYLWKTDAMPEKWMGATSIPHLFGNVHHAYPKRIDWYDKTRFGACIFEDKYFL